VSTPPDRRIAERAPVAVFAAVEAGALVLYMVLGRWLWFYNDEWVVALGADWCQRGRPVFR
jgi:hypothetical protein